LLNYNTYILYLLMAINFESDWQQHDFLLLQRNY
jgi:hypothetical protein